MRPPLFPPTATRLVSALVLLGFMGSLALGRTVVHPGEAFTLVYSGVRGTLSWQVEPFRPLLLPDKGEGLALVVLEVPFTLSPGVYPVCLVFGEATLCQEVEVPRVERLVAQVPARAEGTLTLRLENRGNVPLRVSLSSAPESPVFLPLQEVDLAPGEENVLSLVPGEGGNLVLVLAYGERRERYLVRMEGQGGGPSPYRLEGRLTLGYPGPYGALALEGPLAQGVGVSLRAEGEGQRLSGRLRLDLGSFGLVLSTLPSLGLAYREGPLYLAVAYPWSLEGEWREAGDTYRLEVRPERFRLSYASFDLSLQGGCTLGEGTGCQAPFFRLERTGEPAYFLAWEGGLLLGGSIPGFSLEGTLFPAFSLRGSHWGSLGEGTYRLEGALNPYGGMLAGNLSWPLDPALRLQLSASLGQERALGAGLSYRLGSMSFGLQGKLGLFPLDGSLMGTWTWEEGPYGLRLEGWWTPGSTRLGLEGRYAFSLGVPQEVTLALGGYDRLPLEGQVLLEGKPVASARVVVPGMSTLTDGEGRFRIYLPREGGRVRILPPPGTLAFPLEVEADGRAPLRLELPPASALRLVCEGEGGKGAYLAAGMVAQVACGAQAVLPPGVYRVYPQALPGYQAREGDEEVLLKALEEKTLVLAFQKRPVEVLEEATFRFIRFFPPKPAPGEEVRLEVGGVRGNLWLAWDGKTLAGTPQADGTLRFTFQVPWEAEKSLVLRLQGEGFSRELLLPLDEGRELLEVEVVPARASPGEEVEIKVRVRFPAEGVSLLLPTGEGLALALVGERTYGTRLLVDEKLAGLAEPLGTRRALAFKVVARQGQKLVEKRFRIFLP